MVLTARSPVGAQAAQNPEDVATLDGIIKAYYEVVSGPAGEKADRERDEFLHHPSALVAITSVDATGAPSIVAMSIGEYHDRFGGPRSEGFYEFELHREVQRFGNITHVWSTYAASVTPGGEPFTRGINSIQLYNDGERWWITSWIYDSERAGNSIPARFLPE
jgi:hypothetical protein